MGTNDLSKTSRIFALNRLRWYYRIPCKWIIYLFAYTIVCFPYPHLLVRHLRHWSNPNAMIEPDAPVLQPWVEEFRDKVPPDAKPRDVLKWVQAFVLEKVPYDWDWNTWGQADYFPSVAEVVQMGREDCDGRAVIAASLLRALDYDARLVTDFSHVWVATDFGETMGPGKTKTVEMTDKGVKFQWRGLLEIPSAAGYGIAVFPAFRELTLVAVAWLLLLGRAGVTRSVVCLSLLVAGLFMLRHGCAEYLRPQLWFLGGGIVLFLLGFGLMFFRPRTGMPPVVDSCRMRGKSM